MKEQSWVHVCSSLVIKIKIKKEEEKEKSNQEWKEEEEEEVWRGNLARDLRLSWSTVRKK